MAVPADEYMPEDDGLEAVAAPPEKKPEGFWSRFGGWFAGAAGLALGVLTLGLAGDYLRQQRDPGESGKDFWSFWDAKKPVSDNLSTMGDKTIRGVKYAANSVKGIFTGKPAPVTAEQERVREQEERKEDIAAGAAETESGKSNASALMAGMVAVPAGFAATGYVIKGMGAALSATSSAVSNAAGAAANYSKTAGFLTDTESWLGKAANKVLGFVSFPVKKVDELYSAQMANSRLVRGATRLGGVVVAAENWANAGDIIDEADALDAEGKTSAALEKRRAAYLERATGVVEGLGASTGFAGTIIGAGIKDWGYVLSGGRNSGGVTRSGVSNFIGNLGGDSAAEWIMEHGAGKTFMTMGKWYDNIFGNADSKLHLASPTTPKLENIASTGKGAGGTPTS